jgi:prepilin-type N-terminal cleavage/methylation domain-containing protein
MKTLERKKGFTLIAPGPRSRVTSLDKGFTLIELLVVIAIIALLLAVILPALGKAKFVAKRVICATRLKQTGIGMKMYADASKESLPPGTGDDHGYALYRMDKPQFINPDGTLIPLRFACLYEMDFIDTPELFYCPGNRMSLYKYESYINPGPWGTLPQNFNTMDEFGQVHNQWVRMGYTYYPIEKVITINAAINAPDPATKFILLNQNLPYTVDILHGLDNLSHQYNANYSVNGLYPDAHVSLCNDPTVFELPVWERFDKGTIGYPEFYFTILQAIGVQ